MNNDVGDNLQSQNMAKCTRMLEIASFEMSSLEDPLTRRPSQPKNAQIDALGWQTCFTISISLPEII